jgi:uncharacterized membrane protein
VFSILRSKFSAYRDFHTLLYTCAREFDFLGLEMPYKTTLTLLLPAAALASCLAFYHTIRAMMNKKERVDAAVVYNVAQMVCYGIMALIIMRLKLFFTPQMCVVAGLLASKKARNKLKVSFEIILEIGAFFRCWLRSFPVARCNLPAWSPWWPP